MLAPAKKAGAGRQVRWTRDNIIKILRRWVELYGEVPRAADFSPSSARWADASWRAERYYKGDPETGESWPSLNAIKAPFDGSLNAAIVAAGFEPNKPGPPARRKRAAPEIERQEMSPEVRAIVRDLETEVREANEKIEVRERMLAKANADADAARAARDEARRKPARVVTKRVFERVYVDREVPVTEVRTNTEVKKVVERVKVEDKSAIDRLRKRIARLESRLEDREAVLREVKDQAAAGVRDVRSRDRQLAKLTAQLDEARTEAEEAESIARGLRDQVVALEKRPAIVERVEVESANDVAVREAQTAAHEAEVRAARAERQMRELASLVTGEERRLTADEVAELRKGGPSGPGVLAKSIKQVAAAGRDQVALRAALTNLAGAAIRWRESLR